MHKKYNKQTYFPERPKHETPKMRRSSRSASVAAAAKIASKKAPAKKTIVKKAKIEKKAVPVVVEEKKAVKTGIKESNSEVTKVEEKATITLPVVTIEACKS